MKKQATLEENKLKVVDNQTTQAKFPVPLEFDANKKHPNYLQRKNGSSDQNKLIQIQQKENRNTKVRIDKPLEKQFLNKKPTQMFLKVDDSDHDEDSSCGCDKNCDSECDCVKNMIPKRIQQIKIERRRRKKIDSTPFYDQIIYADPRMRRINFVWSSSGSSDSEYERVQIRKELIPEKQYKEQTLPSEKSIPLPEHQLEVQVLPPPPIKIIKPPEIQQPKEAKPQKQPKIKKYRPSPPTEEWAKYETPNVVHPQILKKPSKKEQKPAPTKPKYGKPKERVEFKVPKSQPIVNDFIPKALPTSKPESYKGGKKKESKANSSSDSGCFYECECMSDCGC